MNQKTRELNRSNNALDQQISAENQEAFTDMICYLRGAKISPYHQELVRQDLTEMVLSAQQRGEPIRSVIGTDYKAFCDDVIANLPPETRKQRVIDSFDIVCWCLSILGLINIVLSSETILLVRNAITGKPLDFSISISLGSVISIGIIIPAAFMITSSILKNSFQIKQVHGKRMKAFMIGAGQMLLLLLIAWFGQRTLFTINIFIACAVVLAFYAAHKLLERI
ncbi:hypothetical protein SDC9_62990 [bioreactor metagenome]|uniref:DUF1129 domain-containing protein n=1 Tax=bioreactor metagenome TaxID=1076179 RepID=A0A644XKI5_9ZZZZ|nr:hypothetical protein [Oscillibacter sp.]